MKLANLFISICALLLHELEKFLLCVREVLTQYSDVNKAGSELSQVP